MNRQQFSELVKDPGTLGAESAIELESLLKQYPYCSSAQLLLTLNFLQQNHPDYQAQFKKAVAYAGDRKRLKELLEGKKNQVPVSVTLAVSEPVSVLFHDQVEVGVEAQDQVEVGDKAPVQPEVKVPVEVEVPVSLLITKPRHDNFIEESVISEQELALASTEPSVQEPLEPGLIKPLRVIHKSQEISQEKLSQEDLLTIVRKRLAEIKAEKSSPVPKKETETMAKDSENVRLSKTISAGPNPSKDDLIEKFIREEPQISRPKKEFFNPTSSSQKSNMDEEDIVSETLALLYAKQGNMQKAIHIYEKLSLRFSEKSRYFAAQIENLKS